MTNNSQPKSTRTETIRTAGEILSSGGLIEVISPGEGETLRLALWKDGKLTVADQICVDGQCFVPLEIDPSIRRAMPFPPSTPLFTGSKQLLADLAGTFEQFAGFSSSQSPIPAAWSVATWFPEFHQRLPNLGIGGWSVDQAMSLFRLLKCVTRHPLMLTGINPSSFRMLPMELRPTLLVNQPRMPSSTLDLLQASNYPDLMTLGPRGDVSSLATCKAIYLGPHASHSGRFHVSLPSYRNTGTRLISSECRRIRETFQSRLLAYRMEYVSKRQEQNAADASLQTWSEDSASLRACVQDDEFAARLTKALENQKFEAKIARGRMPEVALVEVLWAAMHDSQKIPIKDITRFINTLIRTRGEYYAYDEVEIGLIASNLGLPRKREMAGMVLRFTTDIQERVHELSSELGLNLSLVNGCQICERYNFDGRDEM